MLCTNCQKQEATTKIDIYDSEDYPENSVIVTVFFCENCESAFTWGQVRPYTVESEIKHGN